MAIPPKAIETLQYYRSRAKLASGTRCKPADAPGLAVVDAPANLTKIHLTLSPLKS